MLSGEFSQPLCGWTWNGFRHFGITLARAYDRNPFGQNDEISVGGNYAFGIMNPSGEWLATGSQGARRSS
jgi:hypothetical protein